MDEFRWPLTKGLLLSEGPLLSKQYNGSDPVYTVIDDFIGQHVWLYLLAGDSCMATQGEGRLLRILPVTGGSECETNADGDLTRIRNFEGESAAGTDAEGLLNVNHSMSGEGGVIAAGEGLFLRIKAIEGISRCIASFRNDYVWPLTKGLLLSEGPLLSKQYNGSDPVYTVIDDFIGQHRCLVMRLKAVAGESIAAADGEGILALLWRLLGASGAEADGEGSLALDWSLSGESIAAADGEGILSLLWRLLGDSTALVSGEGSILRLRQIEGESAALTTGDGVFVKWPLRIVIGGAEGLSYIGSTVRLTAEFFDANNRPEDPEYVNLRIYNGICEVIAEYPVTPHAPGKYRIDYTIPIRSFWPLVFEFTGKHGSRTVLARANIEKLWSLNL